MSQASGRTVAVLASVISVFALVLPARADSVADFYKDKTMTFLVGFGAGGTYTTNAQLMAAHMRQYIPGKPVIIVQHMPGAGGTRAANYLVQAGPQDGTMLGFMSEMLAIGQLLRPTGVRYDTATLHWIGRLVSSNPVIAVRSDSPVEKFDDLRSHELYIGTSGRGSQGYILPVVMNAVLGTKWKVIVGYSGIRDNGLAVERSELQGFSTNWAGWKLGYMDWLTEKKMRLLVQVGVERESELPDVPLMSDFATSDDDRRLLEFISLGSPVGRSIIASPNVPSDRIAALRAAFDETVRDPAFLADAKKRKVDLNPAPGVEVEKHIRRTMETPSDLVAKARKIIAAAD